MNLIWTLAVTGVVAALGLYLVLRWLGRAGVPVPLAAKGLAAKGYVPDSRECVKVFTVTFGFRILIFLLVGLAACIQVPDRTLFCGSGKNGTACTTSTWRSWAIPAMWRTGKICFWCFSPCIPG